jgi:type II secretory pathway pseudopilin PulG
MGIFGVLLTSLRGFLLDRAALAAENLALRQQLNVLQQSFKRVRLRRRDRVFWALLSRMWNDWRSSLTIVKPETVIARHHPGAEARLSVTRSRPLGGSGRLPTRSSHRSGRAGFPHPARQITDSLRVKRNAPPPGRATGNAPTVSSSGPMGERPCKSGD